jgi:DNA-binding response OmpR family regulator
MIMRILLISYQPDIPTVLNSFLLIKTNLVNIVEDNSTALTLLQDFEYDLVIIASNYHNKTGIILCSQIRATKNKVPILVMTNDASGEEQILGLDAGADDFLINLVEVNQVNARIRSLLRRKELPHTPLIIKINLLSVDLYAKTVTYQGQLISLRPKEFSILELFVRNPDRVFSRDAILRQVWDYQSDLPDDSTVKSHIRSLRMNLKMVGAGEFIETIYGIGYRFNSRDLSREEDSYASACA